MMVRLNHNHSLRDKGLSNALDVGEMPRHRWYFVKEGFSPKLVDHVVEVDNIPQGGVLLDPFSGSGTVPVTGALLGFESHSYEVNPFLKFLSSTKLKHTSPNGLKRASEDILKAARRQVRSPLEGYSTFTPGNRWDRWLFPLPVIRAFQSGSSELRSTESGVRPFLKLALIGAAMDTCNAVHDGKCLRYPKGWKDAEATAGDFRERFSERIQMIAEDLKAAPVLSVGNSVTEGDARALVKKSEPKKFDFCVTSPPYLNSFDYSDVYRPEMFLGGFVDSNSSLMQVRLSTLRSHVQANWTKPGNNHYGRCTLML